MASSDLVHPEIENAMVRDLEKKGYTGVRMEISAGSVKGDNYMGIIAKALITAKDSEGKDVTLHRIIKISSQNDEYRSFTHVDKIFGREAYMYEIVLPELVKYQAEVLGAKASEAFQSFTCTHYTCLEPYREAIVMEDMKQKGYIMRNRREPVDYNHTMMVLREYGRFHAVSLAMREQRPADFQRLSDNLYENWFHDLRREPFERLLAAHNKLGKSSLREGDDATAVAKHQAYVDNCYERLMATLRPDVAGKYAVIGHGDSWVNNVLFKYNNSTGDETKPDQLCFLDFQLSRVGSPALDVAYFIFTCTDKTLRDAHYDAMLHTYHDSVRAHLELLGASSVDILFPFTVLEEHMRQFAVYGLMMTGMVLHVMMSESDEIPDTKTQTTEEMIAAMSFTSKNEDVVKERLRDVILDMVAKGYLE